MRFTTYGKTENGLRFRMTTVHLDCGHTLEYRGDPDEAEHKVRSNGGSIGSSGVSRCGPCTQANNEHVFHILGKRSTEGLPS